MKRLPVTLAERPHFSVLPPLGLYVHLPWCVRKCPYCDFNSHRAPERVPEDDYVGALITDLEQVLPLVWGRRVQTIFFGGGTPSLFSAHAFARILSEVRARLTISPDAEITLEANPGTVDSARFAAYRDAGVNRLSVGIQTFDDRHLVSIGRIHDAATAMQAATAAARNFESFNLDLMFALPGQTPSDLARDLTTMLQFEPPHVSIYHLTIEPNTAFARRPPVIPDDDAAAALQDTVIETVANHGFENYEVSAFARPGKRCRHNLNYWNFGDYIGIGAGAHAKISTPRQVIRQVRTRNPAEYMNRVSAGTHITETTPVEAADLPFEFALNAFRLTDGFNLADYTARTGLPTSTLVAALDAAEQRGLIDRDHLHVRPTPHGRRFLNDLIELFLPD